MHKCFTAILTTSKEEFFYMFNRKQKPKYIHDIKIKDNEITIIYEQLKIIQNNTINHERKDTNNL